MERRTLGRTGMQVSPLCLGAMMFGAWGEPDHDESIRIIHAALDAGIGAADVRLSDDVLDRIDEIVAPGTTLSEFDRGYVPPSIADPALRRRR